MLLEGISFHKWELCCCTIRLRVLQGPPFLPACALLKTFYLISAASRASPAPCSTGHIGACPAWLRVGAESPLKSASETKVQTECRERDIARAVGCTVPGKTSQSPAQLKDSWERPLVKDTR